MKDVVMNKGQREIQRKLRILGHAEEIRRINKICRYSASVEAVFIDGGMLTGSMVKKG